VVHLVAVAEARRARRHHALPVGAAGHGVRDLPAYRAAVAAVVGIDLVVDLAAVGGICVAVAEARVARGEHAHAAHTPRHGVGQRAHLAAGAAVLEVAAEGDLAAVARVGIAALEAGRARSQLADPARAGGRRVGEGAGLAAAPARRGVAGGVHAH